LEFTPLADPAGVRMLLRGYGSLNVENGVTKLSLVGTRVVVWLKPVVGPVKKAPMLLLKIPKPPWKTVVLWNTPGA
jgi:hypothetical protein